MQNVNRPEFLVCPPTYMSLSVPINRQMMDSKKKNDAICTSRAGAQWEDAMRRLSFAGAVIHRREAIPNLQDLTFCADAGLVEGNTVLLSKYRYSIREKESEHHRKWLVEKGYVVRKSEYFFEGGDVVREGNTILIGYGFRSEFNAADQVRALFPKRDVLSVSLIDPYFYHLDTCLHALDKQTILYYPPAIDASSQRMLKRKYKKAIPLLEEDALNFSANMVRIKDTAFLYDCSSELETTLAVLGYLVERLDLSEFLKTGGSINCLKLQLN